MFWVKVECKHIFPLLLWENSGVLLNLEAISSSLTIVLIKNEKPAQSLSKTKTRLLLSSLSLHTNHHYCKRDASMRVCKEMN